jgi:endoglucanase
MLSTRLSLTACLVLLGVLGCSSEGTNGSGIGGALGGGAGSSEKSSAAGSSGSSSKAGGGNRTSSSAEGGAAGRTGSPGGGGSGSEGLPGSGGGGSGNGGDRPRSAGGGGASSTGSSSGGGGGGAYSGGGGGASGRTTGSGGVGAGGANGARDGGSNDPVVATTMAIAMGFGTNIGNTLENTTAWETGWGQPLISQAYIQGMASRGIKTVRVPVAWDTYAVNGVIDATKMNRVKEVVSWIEGAGMYSIVNIHWDGGWIFNENNSNKFKLTDDVKTKFASYWTQIATAFSDVGHKLILEGMNEEGRYWVNGIENGTPDYAALNTMNQLFVTTVRAQSGYNKTRALLIAGFTTDIEKTCVSAFTIPNDPAGDGKLFLSLHYYTPYTFCGLDSVESWGSPQTTWGTDAEKATLQSLFTKAADFSAQRKIPVILGEFGVTLGEKYPRESASRILWMESVAKACFAHGMVPVLWDTGSEIKRTDGSFSTELQSVLADLP